MIKVACPSCNARAELESGYYLCKVHGVVPYDWAMGTINQSKALDMMEKWGVQVKRPKKVDAPTAEPVRGDVASLLNRLKVAVNPVDKRQLRAALRKLGHKGGARG